MNANSIIDVLLLPLKLLNALIQAVPPPPGLQKLPSLFGDAGGLSLPTGPPASSGSYQNLEEWEIVRNDKGRIAGIRIHRDARFK